MPTTARHASPRALLLPGLLIVAAASALTGMAAVPGAASAASGTPDRAAADGLAATMPTMPTMPTTPAEAARQAQALAQERRDERASRDRRPAPTPAVVVPPPPPLPQFVRPGTGRLTSGYGHRWGRLHAGIDLAAGTGAPISAVAAGTVASAAHEGGYGRVVRLQHDDGTLTLYAHLSQLLVQPGQRVTAGTYVGLEGSSGRSTGPHLHFEVRVDGVPVDPDPWLRARGIDPAAQQPPA